MKLHGVWWGAAKASLGAEFLFSSWRDRFDGSDDAKSAILEGRDNAIAAMDY
jgi:hypothetical protein